MMISTKEAARILGYTHESSVFNLLGKADKVIAKEVKGRKRKAALWDKERVIAGRDRREEFYMKKRKLDKSYYSGATRTCLNCGQMFTQKRKESICPSCSKGMKKADPYGVYQVEELAMSRTCRHPGCTNHPRKSSLYCDQHREQHKGRFEELSSSLGDIYTI